MAELEDAEASRKGARPFWCQWHGRGPAGFRMQGVPVTRNQPPRWLGQGSTNLFVRFSSLRIVLLLSHCSNRFLYWFFQAQDANFRLKGRHRDTKMLDVTLSPGWSYFVEHKAYMTHVSKFANQEEVRIQRCLYYSF